MANRPLVSICIPVYNGSAYLRPCLDSCINQTFKDYEILVSDDCSTDNTVSIVEEYCSKHPNIRLVRNEKNLGLVGNWNKCLQEAKGEWIKFVFQDDYIEQKCLEKFVARIKPEVQLMLSARSFILPEDVTDEQKRYYNGDVRTLENAVGGRLDWYPPELISQKAIQNLSLNFIGEPSLTFFRRDIVNELGLFKSELKQICDLEFFLRIATRYGLVYIPERICHFRVHKGSTTNSNIKDKYFELRYIEPVVFVWHLLYEDVYHNFRKSLNIPEMLKLKLYFKVKTYEAARVNALEKHGHYVFDKERSPFVEIVKYQNADMLIKLVSLFRK